ncbi:hypothetical protein QQF64_000899 [Cirrhinus molitorella]|uniref:VWA7 Ig-like domain-containing protein n=1 Tax=Cirrhinus molitorella TaxID=172907 RepID=A0ABR3NZX2_9TELE
MHLPPQAQSQNTTQPEVPLNLNFTLATNTTGGNYTIRVRTDQGFSVSFLSSLTLGPGGSTKGSVTLTAPSDTQSGRDVTLTIEAEALGPTDLNRGLRHRLRAKDKAGHGHTKQEQHQTKNHVKHRNRSHQDWTDI